MEAFRDTQSRWFSDEQIPGVEYTLNEAVQVIDGEHVGAFAAVTSLQRLDPEPAFLIELASGHDLIVDQQRLRRVD